jgi:hypothetical protein
LTPRITFTLRDTQASHWHYVRAVLLLGAPLSYFADSAAVALGAGVRLIVMLLASLVPAVAFVLVFRRYLRRRAAPVDKFLMFIFLGSRVLVGMASGWLGAGVSLALICTAAYVLERRRLPLMAVAIVLPLVLFLQPGKGHFRQAFWSSRVAGGITERMLFWVNTSIDKWASALQSPNSGQWYALAEEGIGRMSLLPQSATVMELTPSVIPHQHGRLYGYLAVTLIPRALWPGKPSVNEANRFFQVAYGMTEEKNLEHVSISVGVLTESYINFGWVGVVIVMFGLGVLFDVLQCALFSFDSGHLLTALGIALIPRLLTIESQMAQYVGGLIQTIVLVLLVFSPVLYRCQRSVMPADPGTTNLA